MITGDDYIALAGRLAAKRDAGEASCRSAVSRAYYGAFHIAASFLAELGFSIPKGSNAHGWIPQALIGSGNGEAADAGRLLQDLHADRIVADYRWEKPATGNQSDARTAIETSHEIRSLLAACGSPQARPSVKSGIASYLRKRGG